MYLLICGYQSLKMITKLQSEELEKLDMEKRTREYTQIFLGGGNSINFMGGLGGEETGKGCGGGGKMWLKEFGENQLELKGI